MCRQKQITTKVQMKQKGTKQVIMKLTFNAETLYFKKPLKCFDDFFFL